MKIVNGFCERLEYGARLALREELLSKDLVQELPTLQHLRYNVNLVFGVVNLQNIQAFIVVHLLEISEI